MEPCYMHTKIGDLLNPKRAAITPLKCIDLRVKWDLLKG